MTQVDFLKSNPKVKRDYDKRLEEKTPEVVAIAKLFGKEFFDGDRICGYGGYKYDGRWVSVAEEMRDHYQLPDDAAILDVGCAKGFLLHDFQNIMPECTVAGVDVSEYALDQAMDSVKPFLQVASAEKLPYPDKSFDLVVCINTVHNLPLARLKTALEEIERVSRAHKFVSVDAWETNQQRENLFKWVLTAETVMHVEDWKRLFKEVGYGGDYSWFITH
jgi:ubiquinone/menaquinone biosynthesis C-methylase UbiE